MDPMLGWLLFATWCVFSVRALAGAFLKWRRAANEQEKDTARRCAVIAAIRALLIALGLRLLTWFARVYVFALWYQDLGYGNRYWTEFNTKMLLFWVAFVPVAIFYAANAYALRGLFAPDGRITKLLFRAGAAVLCLGGALYFGFDAELYWDDLLLFLHQQPFRQTDPVFAKDTGSSVF